MNQKLWDWRERETVRQTLEVLKVKVSFAESEASSALMPMRLAKHFLGYCCLSLQSAKNWLGHVVDSPKVPRD